MIKHLLWPAIPATLSPKEQVRHLLESFKATERLAPEERAALQLRQLQELCAYAVQHSPHTAARLKGVTISSLDDLRKIPLLTRRDLQQDAPSLRCPVPEGHAPTGDSETSGSSGEYVTITRTKVSLLFWMANAMRENFWHKRDFSGTLVVSRANFSGREKNDSWGMPTQLFAKTGPAHGWIITTPVAEQARRIEEIDPHYLLVYPNVLDALVRHGLKAGKNLKEVRTIGETLTDDLRARVKQSWGVSVTDAYSSNEMGYIAIQCPDSGLYHTMSENLIVEVLRDDGTPCEAGERGRVVLTDLTNFAMPLIRYDIRDYAEVGPTCTCGRTSPTIRRIVGRDRNMANVNGNRVWPFVGAQKYRSVAPIDQYQVIQKSMTEIEARFVVSTPLSGEQEETLRELIQESLGHPFEVTFVYFKDQIPPARSGKFEEFVCLV